MATALPARLRERMAAGNPRLIATLAASLIFSLSLIYFSGFDLVNPIPVSWPPVHVTGKSGPRSYRRMIRKDPSILTPARLQRLLGLDGRYRLGHAGRGETIALIEEPSRLDMTGIDAFDRRFGLPPPVILTEYSRAAGKASAEETLDIEWVHSLAPGARIAVVTLPDTPGVLPSLPWLQVARDLRQLKPDVVSTSVILNGWQATAALRQFSLAGVDGLSTAPFFAAAGDSGPAATFPGMLPRVIAVGGVSLAPATRSLTGPLPWPGTAGGWDWLSFPKPSYQDRAGASPWRTTPDVAFVAGFPGYAVNIGGVWTAARGASFAAPILAALWAAEMPAHLTAGQAIALLYRYQGVPGVFTNPGGAGAGAASAGLGVPDFRRLAALARNQVAGFPPIRYEGAIYFFMAMVLSVLVIMAACLSGRAKLTAAFLNCLIILAAWFSVGPFSTLFSSADPLSGVLHYQWMAVTLSVLYTGVFTAAPALVTFSGLPDRLAGYLHRVSVDAGPRD